MKDLKNILDLSNELDHCCQRLKLIKENYNLVPGENSIIIIINCLDDHCTIVSSYLKRELQSLFSTSRTDASKTIAVDAVYEKRLFGGLFLPEVKTYESLIPAVHHIPAKKDRKVLVLNLTHIGYNAKNRKWGNFIRYGHKEPSHSCGAIQMLFKCIIEGRPLPADHDLNRLGSYLAYIVKKYSIKPVKSGRDILQLTYYAYKENLPWMKEQLRLLAIEEKTDIIYLGGLEIDVNKGESGALNDRVAILDNFFINSKGVRMVEEI